MRTGKGVKKRKDRQVTRRNGVCPAVAGILQETAVYLAGLFTLFLGCYLLGCILAGSLGQQRIRFPDSLSKIGGWILKREIRVPLCNTLIMVAVCLVLVLPLGVGTAVYLTEYQSRNSKMSAGIRFCMETLASIPSVLYGMFGMVFFVTVLRMGYSILAGSLTMTLVILPVIVETAEEALQEVPEELRAGGRSLGAGSLGTLFRLVLPEASAGILSGVLLAVGRVVGETAVLLYTSGTAEKMPESLMDSGRTLAVQLYLYSSERGSTGKEEFYTDTWRLALLMLILVFLLQSAARHMGRRKKK